MSAEMGGSAMPIESSGANAATASPSKQDTNAILTAELQMLMTTPTSTQSGKESGADGNSNNTTPSSLPPLISEIVQPPRPSIILDGEWEMVVLVNAPFGTP